jgi:2-methylcitrate dehydratase
MSCLENLAAFVCRSAYEDLSETAREQLKIRILDSLGCAAGASEGEPVQIVRRQIGEFEPRGKCTMIGGGSAAPDSAAFYNGALVRYLDFNDAYLAKGETCHPSDNLAAILAGAEYADRTGREVMTALTVAYQVQCRLSDLASVRDKGFDHVTQGSYSVAAGLSKVLGLDEIQTANAIAICGTAFNALRVTRTGRLSHWKGLAFPNAAACCTRVVFLAMNGIIPVHSKCSRATRASWMPSRGCSRSTGFGKISNESNERSSSGLMPKYIHKRRSRECWILNSATIFARRMWSVSV